MSLGSFRDYCRTMAAETDVERDRRLWEQLADEISAYLDRELDGDEAFDLFTT